MQNGSAHQLNLRHLKIAGLRLAIVRTGWYQDIIDALTEGALHALEQAGIPKGNIEIIEAPGAYEIPLICQKAAQKFDGVIALGCVVRGGTPHFEFVAGECASGVMQAGLKTETPIALGVLTVDTLEQAKERAVPVDKMAGGGDNKGCEAADALLQTLDALALIETQ